MILDEYDKWKPKFRLGYFLQLLDRYQMRIEVKHGSAQFIAKRIYILSSVHPSQMYTRMANPLVILPQIARRITTIVHWPSWGFTFRFKKVCLFDPCPLHSPETGGHDISYTEALLEEHPEYDVDELYGHRTKRVKYNE